MCTHYFFDEIETNDIHRLTCTRVLYRELRIVPRAVSF
jgi:hypothetical protein